MEHDNKKNLKQTYARLVEIRRPFVDRAVRNALVTSPMLFPDMSGGEEEHESPPYSFGAKAVDSLANKLVMALFPTNAPFFQLKLNRMKVRSLLEGQEGIDPDDFILEAETALKQVSKEINDNTSTMQLWSVYFELMRQLIVAGTALFYVDKNMDSKIFKLNEFVLESDHMGKVTNIITVEQFTPDSIPKEYLEQIKASKRKEILEKTNSVYHDAVDSNDLDPKSIHVYTGVKWDTETNKWKIWQEIEDIMLEDSEHFVKEKELPYIPVHYFRLPNNTYGRGIVEQMYGYLRFANGMMQNAEEMAAMMSLYQTIVDPNARCDIEELAAAPNGSFHSGVPDGIKVLQSGKTADLNAILQFVSLIQKDLSTSFLVSDAIRREGERVTATEIRLLAQELEQTLGGVYSRLARNFQIPLVNIILSKLKKTGQLPKFDEELTEPEVVTGLSALGRGEEFSRTIATLQTISSIVGPELVVRYIKPDAFLAKALADNGIDSAGILKSKEEIAQEQQAAQQQQLIDTLGPEALKQVGNAAQQQPPQQQ